MVVPNGRTCTLLWWIDDRLQSALEFSEWEDALRIADELRRHLSSQRFVDVDDDR